MLSKNFHSKSKFKKIIFIIFASYLINYSLHANSIEVNSFTIDIIDQHHVSVAFEDLEKSGWVTCFFLNKESKPIDKVVGYISGVGILKKVLPVRATYVRCNANKK